ncbi:hypothetical protein MKS88_004282 [Plasmodium brasilianum]|uniref:Uncharacterized protein n=1 Tax=Plasmodium brasilianum TaxID=5824 RepID=A0ACB9Y5N4_PLABR|nr:hypothetical protein MKS88_004282 [Plasmodium brasilianum]
MDEEILNKLTSRELKRTILDKAKNILSERKSTINENFEKSIHNGKLNNNSSSNDNNNSSNNENSNSSNNENSNSSNNENSNSSNNENSNSSNNENSNSSNNNSESKCNSNGQRDKKSYEEKSRREEFTSGAFEKKKYLGNENKKFFNLQEFSLIYSKMVYLNKIENVHNKFFCEINDLDYENIEYELLISFMNTFNNELKFQLKLNDNDKQEDKENCVLHKMAKIFIDKLIYYCSNPIIFLTQKDNNNNSLFDNEIIGQISSFFEQIEQNRNGDILFKICLSKILQQIFNFKPNPEDMASWISRQAFVVLVKILIDQDIKKHEQCITYTVELIKKNLSSLDFFQVDNVVVLIEIIQYAIIYLSENKYNTKNCSFNSESWFEDFGDLIKSLRSSEWKIFLNQLIVIETFLYDKKREGTKKVFNKLYRQQIELSAIKNCSYSKWFKIEMPLSMSLFK